jgi:hypothetical protein
VNKKCNTSKVYLLLIFYALRAFFFLSDVKTPNVAFDREYCFYDFFVQNLQEKKNLIFYFWVSVFLIVCNRHFFSQD